MILSKILIIGIRGRYSGSVFGVGIRGRYSGYQNDINVTKIKQDMGGNLIYQII